MDLNTLLNDPVTWTSLGLIIFLAVVFIVVKPHKSIAKSLDERSGKIRSELDNAAALRKEAEAKLADAERRQAEAEAVRDVRLAAVDTASKAAAQILTDTLVGKAADDHFAASLEKVTKALA